MPETTPSAPRPALRDLIRNAMRAKGIRSVDGEQGLAKRAGIARNTIYAWEGGAYPRIGELERLGRFLDVPAWQLLRAWERGEMAQPNDQPDVVRYENGKPVAIVEVKALESKIDAIITREEVLDLVAGVESRVTTEIQTNRAAIIDALADDFVDAAMRKLAQTPDGARLLGSEDPSPGEEEPQPEQERSGAQ